ncbi:unnamed protein product [Cochlearia groenlandica]
MNYRSSYFLVVLSLVTALNVAQAGAKSKVHIVYLGEKQHDDPDFVTKTHHEMLSSLLGSEEEAHDSMVHSYRHGFSGFAAKLTESQAKKLADLAEVVHVIPDSFYELSTTRTWDYLGLSAANPKNLLNDTNMGDQVIIGFIDSGVWPESESFNDNGVGPIPSDWKGGCEPGQNFTSKNCNRKLIGAKYFINGFLAENEGFNSTQSSDYISARDFVGHGTHVASIAGGSFVPYVSYKGLAAGNLRGGAPRARIAIYKACWYVDQLGGVTCSSSDILKAMDEAIHDGVDVLSLSLGPQVPLYPETDLRDSIATGAFHAVAKGVIVVCAGGNSGPSAQTVVNTAPWILTVAATTLDRSFPTPITLGNNNTILGQALYTGPELGFTSLVYPETSPGNSNVTFSGVCERLNLNPNRTMTGKVVLCFTTTTLYSAVSRAASYVKAAGGLGVIIARNPGYNLTPCRDDFPCVAIDYELGTDILVYIRSTRSPVVKIQPSRTLVGQPIGTKVATFSSRGPNSLSPAILKPDIAAPGVSILAATSPNSSFSDTGFDLLAGTSMAAPVISGVVALLKALHPNWSPAAFRSAIVTTAWRTDPLGEQLSAEGSSRKVADPFDYGGGLVNPEKAAEPGLIYDMGPKDYILYLCSAGYNASSISQLVGKRTLCSNPIPSVLDMNLPSITIPNLNDEVTLTRTVTNVGRVRSVYNVVVEPPLGVQVVVTPETLVFNSRIKRVSFTVRVSNTHKINTGYNFGSLIWTSYVHNVTIPVSVRTQILQNYYDEN